MEVPRVLIFSTAYKPLIGGSEIAIDEITKRLGHIEFDIITPRFDRKSGVFEKDGNRSIHRVGLGIAFDKYLLPFLGAWLGFRFSLKHHYRSSHAFQASYGAVAGALLSFVRPSIPFVITLQEGKNLPLQSFLVRKIRNFVLRRSSIITAISAYLVRFASEVNPKAHVVIIPNGVSVDNFRSKQEKTEDGLIISVSRLVKKNGIDVLLRAMPLVENSFHVMLIGDGKELNALQKLSAELGIRDRVEFAGSIENSKIPDYLHRASMFIRPSRSEGLGVSFLEAMAAGVPIIATPVGGISDFLIDGETGLFCKVDDPPSLAFAIRRISQDVDLRKRVIVNAYEMIKNKYDWDSIALVYKKELYA